MTEGRYSPAYWHIAFAYSAESGSLIWRDGFGGDRTGLTAGNGAYQADQITRSSWVVKLHGKTIRAHRIIWEMHHGKIPSGMVVDHKDGDPWNNRLDNLRLATHAQNARNASMSRRSTSGVKGVSWNKKDQMYIARIMVNGESIYLGSFRDIADAAKARRIAAEVHHGEFAKHA